MITNDCKSNYCKLCFKNDLNYCLVCSSNFTFISYQNYARFKKCEEYEESEKTEKTEKTEIYEEETECSIKMIMNNKCMNKTISIEKYEEIYQKLKKKLQIGKKIKKI